jgi:hypothetical protein
MIKLYIANIGINYGISELKISNIEISKSWKGSDIECSIGDLSSGLDFEPKDPRFNPQTAQK